MPKKKNYTATIIETEDWWIGWFDSIPGINCQEKTRDDLIESLKEAFRESKQIDRIDSEFYASEGIERHLISL